MIRADYVADITLFFMQQARTTMAAYVMESMQRHIVVTRHDNRVLADIDGHAITRLRHIRLYADVDPVLAEDHLQIARENTGIDIEWRLERVSRASSAKQGAQVVDGCVHRRALASVRKSST